MLNVGMSFFFSQHKNIKNRGFVKKLDSQQQLGDSQKKLPTLLQFFRRFSFPLQRLCGKAELEQALEAFNLLKVDPLFDV